MRMFKLVLAAAALSAGTVAVAGIRLDARSINQQRQIDAGKRSGKLSQGERNMLTNEQNMIKRAEARMHARHGNKLSDADKTRLNAMLDRSQRHIERLKHNRRRGRHGVHVHV